MPTSVYQADFYQWIQTTVNSIRHGKIESLDWEHLVEELEDLGNEQKNQLESRLLALYEHLLKLAYWPKEREYNHRGWQGTILEQRKQLKRLLKRNPSLKPYVMEVAPEIYEDARQITSIKTGLDPDLMPELPIANPEQVLDENWFPNLEK